MTDLPTIEHLSKELAAGRTTSLALTEAALSRATDPLGEGRKTFTALNADRALAMARASDLLRASGVVRSPMEGLPVSVKDLFDVAGEVTTAGSVVLKDRAPAVRTAPAIERLIAAGAVVVGRTNMTEFAFSGLGLNPHYGTPRNPWDRVTGRIPGGSSSGAAVSVSDGMAVVAIGSDTGGSVRIPSALCGLTGFKPTQRRVPLQGTWPLSHSLDSIGPLAASVRCCVTTDAVLAGERDEAPLLLKVAGARLAVPETLVFEGMDATVANAFERALGQLSAAGATIVRMAVPEFAESVKLHARGTLAGAEAWATHRGLLAGKASAYDPRVSSRIFGGDKMGAADYVDLALARQQWISRVEARLSGFDAMLLPTVPVVAPVLADLEASDEAYWAANGLILRNSTLINFLDGCALSLPCHRPDEPPVGLMVAGVSGQDQSILGLGLDIEAVLKRAY